jgi:hypothetical protein
LIHGVSILCLRAYVFGKLRAAWFRNLFLMRTHIWRARDSGGQMFKNNDDGEKDSNPGLFSGTAGGRRELSASVTERLSSNTQIRKYPKKCNIDSAGSC